MFIYPTGLTIKNIASMKNYGTHDESPSYPEIDYESIVANCLAGREENVAEAADSEIFLARTLDGDLDGKILVKAYTHLGKRCSNNSRVLDAVNKYAEDTLEAKKIFDENPNPLNQSVTIGGEQYEVVHRIVPQGKAMMLKNGLVCSVGQEFVPGKPMLFLMNDPNLDCVGSEETVSITPGEVNEINTVNMQLMSGVPIFKDRLSYSSLNVKVALDRESKKAIFTATDATDNIYDNYWGVIQGFSFD